MAISFNNSDSSVLSKLGLNNSNVKSRDRDAATDYSSLGRTSIDTKEVASKAKEQVLTQSDFLKLLTTQLQHQDPSEPMDNSQMVTQLSQMSMVENLTTINTSMGDIISAVSSSSALSASTLVGRSVLVESKTAFFDGRNPVTAKIHAGDGYGDIKIVVKDRAGNVVSEYKASGGKGDMDFSWDGVKPTNQENPEAPNKPDGSKPEGSEKPETEGETANGKTREGDGQKPTLPEFYEPGMYTIEAEGIDLKTGQTTRLPVSMYATVGSVTLGKTQADTMLNLIGYGDIKLSDVKEVAL